MSAVQYTEVAVGGAAGWVVPKGTRCIEGMKVSFHQPTAQIAAQPMIPRIRLDSFDLKVTPCQLLLEGSGSCVANQDNAKKIPTKYFPLNISTVNKDGSTGGQTILAWGTTLAAAGTTTGGWCGITFYFNDTGPVDLHADGMHYGSEQYFYNTAALITATTAVTLTRFLEGATYRLAGARRITGVYGMVYQVASVAAIGINGTFEIASTDLKVPFPIRWMNEPADSFLLAGAVDSKLSICDQLDIPCNDQTTIQGAWTNGAPNTIGAFITGVQYQ